MLFDVKTWKDNPCRGLDTDKIDEILRDVDADKLRRDLFSSEKIVVEPAIAADLEVLVDRHLSRVMPTKIIQAALLESRISYGDTFLIDRHRFCDLMASYCVALDVLRPEQAGHLSTVVAATYGTTASEGFQLHHWMTRDVSAKYWVSSRDDNVRYTHSAADGLEVDLEAAFACGEDRMRYPGDPYASFENVIGCRCSMLPR